MELQTISTSRRMRAMADGWVIEAQATRKDGCIKIENGSIKDGETGAWLAGFSVNGSSAAYNFNTSDRMERSAMVDLIENFIVELNKNEENEESDAI